MNRSPVVTAAITPDSSIEFMDFPSALAAAIAGERISKQEWNNPSIYGEVRQGHLMLHKEDGWHRWILSDGDLLGEDWFVIDWVDAARVPKNVQ